MKHAEKLNKKFDYVGLLEPSPFITPNQLDGALSLLEENKEALAVVAVKESRPTKILFKKKICFWKNCH